MGIVDTVPTHPRIAIVSTIVLLPLILLYLSPSALNLFGFYLVDTLSLIIVHPVEMLLFLKLYPRCSLFFPELKPAIFEIAGFDEKVRTYKAMTEFPCKRAIYISLASLIKIIPAIVYVVLTWDQDLGSISTVISMLLITLFPFLYFTATCFLRYHKLVYEQLEKIHAHCDWSDVFKAAHAPPNVRSIPAVEMISIIMIWLFSMGLVAITVLNTTISRPMALAQLFWVGSAALLFMLLIIGESRGLVTNGIKSIVDCYASFEVSKHRSLPLSTHPTVAFYQKAFNRIMDAIKQKEKELHRWIIKQSEEHRYAGIGKLAGLLVHDMASGLSLIRYCSGTLLEKRIKQLEDSKNCHWDDLKIQMETEIEIRKEIDYLSRINECNERIIGMVTNVRDTLRANSSFIRTASINAAHEAALHMVAYTYKENEENEVQFERITTRNLLKSDFLIAIPQIQLNQILLNLYSNSYQNLITNQVKAPEVSISYYRSTEQTVTLVISDNGTGLKKEQFQFITEDSGDMPMHTGIGLKLTRRIVELYGGSLRLTEQMENTGTKFLLTLPKQAQSEKKSADGPCNQMEPNRKSNIF